MKFHYVSTVYFKKTQALFWVCVMPLEDLGARSSENVLWISSLKKY
jgi:hypothetical protein